MTESLPSSLRLPYLNSRFPKEKQKEALFSLIHLFVTYIISFHVVATYWINHHHLIQAAKHVSPGILWANVHLLFWLSLIPFATGWLGENHGGALPTAFYASILCACAIAYTILQQIVIRHAEHSHALREEIKRSWKGKISLGSYLLAIPFAFVHPVISDLLIVAVTMIWFIPDQRIERHL